MIKSKFVLTLIVGTILFLSINFSPNIRQKVLEFPLYIKSTVFDIKNRVVQEVKTLFHQKKQIERLRKELETCQKTATLSVAFASKLNHFLEENKLDIYDPDLFMVRGLSYIKLGDFSKMWLDFPDYNHSRIYGLLFKGYAAGIVDEQDGKPIARLLSNKKMIFSVEVGKQRDLGVIFGNKDFLEVKYIPTYADIQVGDEVITSGNDNIFYEGVKVGEVIQIQTTNLYKMALVKPYAELHNPEFFYAVDVHSADINERNSTLFSDALK